MNSPIGLHCRSEPPTVLTEEEEDSLACYCVQMADMGFGLTREDVMRTVFTIVEHSVGGTHLQMVRLDEHDLMASKHVILT